MDFGHMVKSHKVTCTLVNYETCEIAAVESFTVFLMAAEIFLMGLKETL